MIVAPMCYSVDLTVKSEGQEEIDCMESRYQYVLVYDCYLWGFSMQW